MRQNAEQLGQAEAWIERGDKVALATIIAVRRSAKREATPKEGCSGRARVQAGRRPRRLGGAPGG